MTTGNCNYYFMHTTMFIATTFEEDTHTHIHTHARTHVHTYTHTHTHTRTRTHTHTHTHTCTYVSIHKLFMHTYTIHAYIHTVDGVRMFYMDSFHMP